MKLILKIAFRNIYRHKAKSLVIGTILFLGALLMTIGSGIISGMDRGLKENILNRFTGHIVLISDNQTENNVIFTMMGRSVETIENYPAIKKTLEAQDYIDKFMPVAREFAMILNEDAEPGMCLLLGVDFQKYQEMFGNNVKSVEGELLKPGERGALINIKQRLQYYDLYNYWVIPKNSKLIENNLSDDVRKNIKDLKTRDDLIFMGFNEKNSALDIRLNIKGIVKFSELNEIWGNFNIIDIESFRECFGWVTGADNAVRISKEKEQILNLDSERLDNLFGAELEFGTDNFQTRPSQTAAGANNSAIGYTTGVSVSSAETNSVSISVDSGAFNLVFIKLRNNISIDEAINKLKNAIVANKLKARVITWRQAAGQIADMAMIIRAALFGFVMLLFFVAIIIIINTLSMAALERVSEIGMMRAVGASKKFVGLMFLCETGFLAFIFGGLGIIIGLIITNIVANLRLITDNDLLQLLYGGDTFRPLLEYGDIALVIIQLIIVTLVAAIYPVIVALKIKPLDAITRD